MTTQRSVSIALVALAVACFVGTGRADSQQQPAVPIPQPGVPQIMTLEGKFVRVAYNNEGYVILGYQIANRTVGQDWIMLDIGMTMMEKVPNYTMKREALFARHTGRNAPSAVDRRVPRKRIESAAAPTADESPARLDQLFPALDARREPSRVLLRPRLPRDAVGSGRGQQRLSRVWVSSISTCPAARSTASTG